jgi:hypothetical protein
MGRAVHIPDDLRAQSEAAQFGEEEVQWMCLRLLVPLCRAQLIEGFGRHRALMASLELP